MASGARHKHALIRPGNGTPPPNGGSAFYSILLIRPLICEAERNEAEGFFCEYACAYRKSSRVVLRMGCVPVSLPRPQPRRHPRLTRGLRSMPVGRR